MASDIWLVAGVLLLLLALVGLFSAFAERRAGRLALLGMLLGGGMIVYAQRISPEGYGLSDVPDAFIRVIALFV